MKINLRAPAVMAALAIVAAPGIGLAQAGWSALDGVSLREGLQQRYDAALAATLDPAIVNANDPRYLWASEAKAQCAIALGFLKSGTRDEVSIGKCGLAADMMSRVPPPFVPPPPPPPQTRTCADGTVVPVSQACPAPPPPVLPPMGERG